MNFYQKEKECLSLKTQQQNTGNFINPKMELNHFLTSIQNQSVAYYYNTLKMKIIVSIIKIEK